MATLPLLEDGPLVPARHELEWTVRDELSSWIKTVRLHDDKVVLSQGTVPEDFHLLRNGLLGIYRSLPNDKSVLIGKIRPGECVGITQMLLGESFPARLKPIKESIALRGTREDVDRLHQDYPDTLNQALLKESYIYTEMYERVQRVLSMNTDERIARELLEFASDVGRRKGKRIKLLAKLSRKDLSRMVGCAHESASRVMSRMEKEGTITTEHKYITIKKPERLLCLVD